MAVCHSIVKCWSLLTGLGQIDITRKKMVYQYDTDTLIAIYSSTHPVRSSTHLVLGKIYIHITTWKPYALTYILGF